jgi:hypothetical protein
MSRLVCVGKIKSGYSDVDLDSLRSSTCYMCTDNTFNELKYDQFINSGKCVITVLGSVHNWEGSVIGYVISNIEGVVSLIESDRLLALLHSGVCAMNYSLIALNTLGGEGGLLKYSGMRRNPGSKICSYSNSELKSKLGYSLIDGCLSNNMGEYELNSLLCSNGFSLAYSCFTKYIDKSADCRYSAKYLMYSNSEGTIINLMLDSSGFRVLESNMLMIRDFDFKAFDKYCKNNFISKCNLLKFGKSNGSVRCFYCKDIGLYLRLSSTAFTFSRHLPMFRFSPLADDWENVFMGSSIECDSFVSDMLPVLLSKYYSEGADALTVRSIRYYIYLP